MNLYLDDEKDVKSLKDKFKLLYIIILSFSSIFLIRLFYLQVIKGDELKEWSDNNHIKPQTVRAARGMIFDRNGEILVDNIPGFVAVIVPQYTSDLRKTSKEVAKIIDIDPEQIIKTVEKNKGALFRPVIIKENLTRDEVALLEKIRITNPGLRVEMKSKRNYTLGESGVQLFGYVGEITKNQLEKNNKLKQGDIIGRRGVEQYFDAELRGVDGYVPVKVDAFGRESKDINTPEVISFLYEQYYKESKPGHSMFLTIDKKIQQAAYNAFKNRNRIGAAVVLENKTGAVLAWVNSPSFDPHMFWPRISTHNWQNLISQEFKPLRNKVVQDHYAPGSTFKATVALAGLQEGIITKNTEHHCPGYFRFGRRLYHCWRRGGHGSLNVIDALAKSCNVFFYKLGNDLGIDKIAKYARALGFGKKTQITSSQETTGLVPDSEWKKENTNEQWQPGETLSVSVGQGFLLATPIQVANVFSNIANNGYSFKPYFVDKFTRADGLVVKEFNKTLEISTDVRTKTGDEIVISDDNFQIVKQGLWKSVNATGGTGRAHALKEIIFAGKTGTSQIINFSSKELFERCQDRPINLRHHGWFVGFAPFEDPKITVAVLAQHSCSGSGGAAPIARDIIKTFNDIEE